MNKLFELVKTLPRGIAMSMFDWDPLDENKCRQATALVQQAIRNALSQQDPETQSEFLVKAKRGLWPVLRFSAQEMKLKYPRSTSASKLIEREVEYVCRYDLARRKLSRGWKIRDLSWSDVGSFALYSFLSNNIALCPPEPGEEWRTPLLLQYLASSDDRPFLTFIEDSLATDNVSILEPETTSLVWEVVHSEDAEEEYRKDMQHVIALMLAPFIYKAYSWYVRKTIDKHSAIINDNDKRVESQLAVANCWLERYVLLSRDEYIKGKLKGQERSNSVHAYDFRRTPGHLGVRTGFAMKSVKQLYRIDGGINHIFKGLELEGSTPIRNEFEVGVNKELTGNEQDDAASLNLQNFVAINQYWSVFLNHITIQAIRSQEDVERVLLFHLWALHLNPYFLRSCFENKDIVCGKVTLEVESNSSDIFPKKRGIKLVRTSFYDLIRNAYAKKKTISETVETIETGYKELGFEVDLKTVPLVQGLSDSLFMGEKTINKNFSVSVKACLVDVIDKPYFREEFSKCVVASQKVVLTMVEYDGEGD